MTSTATTAATSIPTHNDNPLAAPPPAEFGIVIDTLPVRAGTTVHGKIWIRVRSEIQNCQLQASLVGTEVAQVGSLSNTSTRPLLVSVPIFPTKDNTHEFFGGANQDATTTVNQLNLKSIPPGRYVCPFKLELPTILPASFVFYDAKDTRNQSCAIDYRIKAHLFGSAENASCSCEQPLDIWSAPRTVGANSLPPIPYLGEPTTRQDAVSACCGGCMGSSSGGGGSLTLGARLENTVVEKGQSFAFSYCFRNNMNNPEGSTYKIRAKIVQTCSWTAAKFLKVKSSETILQQITFSAPKDQDSFDDTNRFTILSNELASNKYQSTVTVPLDQVLSTYTGEVVRVDHELVLSSEYVPPANATSNNKKQAAPLQVQVRVPLFVSESQSVKLEATPTPETVIPQQVAHTLPTDFDTGGNDVSHARPVVIAVEDIQTGGLVHHGGATTASAPASVDFLDESTIKPSFETLLRELEFAIGGQEVIEKHQSEINWKPILEGLSPQQYANLLPLVRSAFEQVSFASLVANCVVVFTSQHVAAALYTCNPLVRCSMVQHLADLCEDLHKPESQNVILSSLTAWERTVVEESLLKLVKRKG